MVEDWSYSMIMAEKSLREIGHSLLHCKYGKVDGEILSVLKHLTEVRSWIAQEEWKQASLAEMRRLRQD